MNLSEYFKIIRITVIDTNRVFIIYNTPDKAENIVSVKYTRLHDLFGRSFDKIIEKRVKQLESDLVIMKSDYKRKMAQNNHNMDARTKLQSKVNKMMEER